MNRNEILRQLTLIFQKVFHNPILIIEEEQTAKDIEGWDSLSHMILIVEIEKTFAIKFRLKDITKMKNIGDMMDTILSKTAKN